MKRLLTLIVAFVIAIQFAAPAEDQFFDSNGVQIRYIVEGEGEPIVLIHGFTANLDMNFRMPGIIKALAEDYQVIALDCRGHGKSEKPHGVEHYGIEMVNDVVRLLDHLGIEKAHVSGYSMGGFITMKLLTTHPGRVISALPGGAGWATPDAESVNVDMFTELADSLEAGKGIGPLMIALTPEGQPVPDETQIAQFNAMLMATNDHLALASVIRGLATIEIAEASLRANEVPTLMLIGEIDPIIELCKSAEAVMSELELVVLPGRDHMTAFTDPNYVGNMKRFLAEHSLAAANAATD